MGRAPLSGIQAVSMDVLAEQQLMLPLANEPPDKHQEAVWDKSLVAGQQEF